MDWKIYYSDGSTVDSDQAAAIDAPPHGVICIVQADPVCGRTVLHRWNWYHFVNGEFWGVDVFGILDRLMFGESVTALKQGRTVDSVKYNEIMNRAKADDDFAVKSAARSWERGNE